MAQPDYNNPPVAMAYFTGQQHADAGCGEPQRFMYRDSERQTAYEDGFADQMDALKNKS